MTATPAETCDRPIIGRDGKPLGFNCNLPKGHESIGGKCAQTTRDEPPEPRG